MYCYGIKCVFDIIGFLLLFFFLLIIMILVVIMIKLEDKGFVFYNVFRLGKGMREFFMYKFCLMKVNVLDICNEDGSIFNFDNDLRVIKIGNVLRKISIDEFL